MDFFRGTTPLRTALTKILFFFSFMPYYLIILDTNNITVKSIPVVFIGRYHKFPNLILKGGMSLKLFVSGCRFSSVF